MWKRPTTGENTEWTTLDQKALAMITLSIKTSQLGHVKQCASAHEAWKKLQEAHQPRGPVRKVALFKKLLSKRIQEGQSISSYLSDFKEILDKLAGVGIEILDELTTIILLSSLPDEFDNFVVTIETRDSLPSFDMLSIKLREEGERKRESEIAIESAKAFTVVERQSMQRDN
ncbi:uncharacterized protein [Drosophila tropicalis]|uniref:uncharacterized protein n=1 Tax=Drosophila tropicalis TaxID=46794 RepID=UPI0035ABBB4B